MPDNARDHRGPETEAPQAEAAAAPPPGASPRCLSHGESYISLRSRPASDTPTTPVFHGSNAVGDALIATGIVDLAGPALTAMVPLLPVGMTGLDVREALHRFDASAPGPALEAGVTGDARVGGQMGTLSMRWLAAPDGFEATTAVPPPPTEIQPSRSQRVVMLDGRLQFQDRRQGVLRFFGSGRTFPVTVDGRPRLLFAGTAILLEGLGGLEGVRGTLLMSGEVTPPGGIALTIVARVDPGGPLEAADSPAPVVEGVAGGEGAVAEAQKTAETVVVLVGEGADSLEEVRPARIGSDLGIDARLRSHVRLGGTSGAVAGRLAFDATDHRCGVQLGDSRRVFTFLDPDGRPVGTLTAEPLEGTAFRDVRQGRAVQRVTASAPLSGGTGALAGVAGVVTLDTLVDAAGASSSLYVVHQANRAGGLRPSIDEVGAEPSASRAAAPPMTFVDANGTRITDADRAILAHAERTLDEGIQVLRWWEEKDRAGDYVERFDVVREYDPENRSFGFFERVPFGRRTVPVMGIVQELFYDRQKQGSGEIIRAQLREFVLRYFMRVSHFRQPEAKVPSQKTATSPFERALGWLPEEDGRRGGFGYQQLFYRLQDSGQIGKFSAAERGSIVDLRDIGPKHAWILLKVDVFDFALRFSPFGADAMTFQMPLKESTYLMLGPGFVTDRENPAPGVIGEYGFGYAFVPYAPNPGAIAYGPGHFAFAVQSVNFRVMENGEIRARTAFVVNRPDRIAKIDIDPVNWGFQMADMMTFNLASRVMGPIKSVAERLPLRMTGVDPVSAYIWMANAVSGGLAARQLGISKEVLEKRMLVQHSMQHYAMLVNSLLVWRMIPDWTDHANLPEYCTHGMRG